MSPAKKGVSRTVKAVTGQDKVTIERDGGRVKVKWFCGDSRSFTTDQADLALEAMDRLAEFGEDIWVDVPTSLRAYAQVKDGKLCADSSIPGERGQECDWQEFRKAFAYVTNAAKKAA